MEWYGWCDDENVMKGGGNPPFYIKVIFIVINYKT
jgi:hypothetical protein